MSDDSADEDHTVDVAAQLSTLLKPFNKKMKAMARRMEDAESQLKRLESQQADELPALRSAMADQASSSNTKLQALQGELAQCAGKTAVELAKQEATQAEQKVRAALDEVRARNAAQEMLMHGLEARVDTAERAQRTAETRLSAEISVATNGLQKATAALERLKGEVDARLSELQARSQVGLDGLGARVTAETERLEKQFSGVASTMQVDDVRGAIEATAAELRAGLAALQEQWRAQQESVQGLQAAQGAAVTPEAVARLEARLEAVVGDVRGAVDRQGESKERERAAWEDKLLGRQLQLEQAAAEARRDWHTLDARLGEATRQLAERCLRSESDELLAQLRQLGASCAAKADVHELRERVEQAAAQPALEQLAAEVHELQASARDGLAAVTERAGRAADAEALDVVAERMGAVERALEAKLGASEAQLALQQKLEKAVGDEMGAELAAARERLQAMHERAVDAEARAASLRSEVAAAQSTVASLERAHAELATRQRGMHEALHAHDSERRDVVRAVRALALDADLRCSLDEREVEFLWAAPSQVYGAHGWRKNNGSLSERTPYPAGDFKLAVRHGSEQSAADVLSSRRRLLGSIALAKHEVAAAEADASAAGSVGVGNPVRMPSVDELRKHWSSGSAPLGGMLEPAHAVLGANGDLREFAPIPPPGAPMGSPQRRTTTP